MWIFILWLLVIQLDILLVLGVRLTGLIIGLFLDLLLVGEAADGLDEISLDFHYIL